MSAPPESLATLQRVVTDAVLRPLPLVEYEDLREGTTRVTAGNARLSPLDQMNIYREQFWLRHIDCLREDYPTVAFLLGEDCLEKLAHAYFDRYRPDTFTLRDVGAKLPNFLATTEPWAEDLLLCDAARLEWAFVDAFDAPEAPPLDSSLIADASEDAWAAARVVLHPSLQRVSMRHPVHEMRAKVRAGESPSRPTSSPVHVIVYRGLEGDLQYIDIESSAFALLTAISEGLSLADACEKVACQQNTEERARLEGSVGSWFQQWTSFGWVSRVEFAQR